MRATVRKKGFVMYVHALKSSGRKAHVVATGKCSRSGLQLKIPERSLQ